MVLVIAEARGTRGNSAGRRSISDKRRRVDAVLPVIFVHKVQVVVVLRVVATVILAVDPELVVKRSGVL